MEVKSSENSGPGYYSDVDLDEATGAAANFLDVSGDYHSTGDLFELVFRGCGGVITSEVQPELSSHLVASPPIMPSQARPHVPDVAVEDQPAAVPSKGPNKQPNEKWDKHHPNASHKDNYSSDLSILEKNSDSVIPSENITCKSSQRSKRASGARRSHCPGTQSLTEKRRRCKVNERFKTLQQLVPGCDKSSSQASTLDRTIQYMKSLQQQLQAMPVAGCSIMPAAAVLPVSAMPFLGATAAGIIPGFPPMVPFAEPSMLPMVQQPSVVIPSPLYPAPAPKITPEADVHRMASGVCSARRVPEN